MPSEVAELEFGPQGFQSAAETVKPTFRNFQTLYKGPEGAINTPGNQTGPTRTFVGRMKPKAAKRAQRVIRKTRKQRRGK